MSVTGALMRQIDVPFSCQDINVAEFFLLILFEETSVYYMYHIII
jgi:hypothetical protein